MIQIYWRKRHGVSLYATTRQNTPTIRNFYEEYMTRALLFNSNQIVDIRLTDHDGRQFLMSFFVCIYADDDVYNWLTHRNKKFDDRRFLAIIGWLHSEEIFADKVTKLQLCNFLSDSAVFKISVRSMQNSIGLSSKINTNLNNHRISVKTRGF